MAKITATIPCLASLNLEKSVAFYTQYLGFSKILCDNTIAIIARDGLELHFWKCDDKEIAKNTSCYIHVDNISDLHTEFAKNKVPNLGAPQVRAWGMTEMYILDLDGNLLKFGCQTP